MADMTDKEYDDLKAKLATEDARRLKVAEEEFSAWVKPVQSFISGTPLKNIDEKIAEMLDAEPTNADRNIRMALDAVRMSIRNLRMMVPAGSNTAAPTPAP